MYEKDIVKFQFAEKIANQAAKGRQSKALPPLDATLPCTNAHG